MLTQKEMKELKTLTELDELIDNFSLKIADVSDFMKRSQSHLINGLLMFQEELQERIKILSEHSEQNEFEFKGNFI